MRKKLVYICSPLRGDIEGNIKKAQQHCREVLVRFPDVLPIAPHIYCTQFCDDTIPWEREEGMKMGLELLKGCAELWVFGIDNPSEGMRAEMEYAKKRGIKVRDAADAYKDAVVILNRPDRYPLRGYTLDLFAWQQCKIKRRHRESDRDLIRRLLCADIDATTRALLKGAGL